MHIYIMDLPLPLNLRSLLFSVRDVICQVGRIANNADPDQTAWGCMVCFGSACPNMYKVLL